MKQIWHFGITAGIIPTRLLAQSFCAAWGRVPQPSFANVIEDNGQCVLQITADMNGSGTTHVPVPISGFGVISASTQTLVSNEKPYRLLKELCRGSLGNIGQMLFDWNSLGFVEPEPLKKELRTLTQRFSKFITSDNTGLTSPFSADLDNEYYDILQRLMKVNLGETKAFSEQSVAWRMRNNEKLPLQFGVGTASIPMERIDEFASYFPFIDKGFHVLLPMLSWRELEAEQDNFHWEALEQRLSNATRTGKQIFLGPLLSFTPQSLPDWVIDHIGEDGFLETQVTRYVNSLTERYGYLANGWILADQFLIRHFRSVSQPRLMGIIRTLAQQIRSRGIETPILVGIDQPWGEYALTQEVEWEQVQIAESLMGCREIDAFLLKINLGSSVSATLPYAPMNISNKIDMWSFLGKSVYVQFSVPCSGAMIDTEEQEPGLPQWSCELQNAWTNNLFFTFFGKRLIQGLFWMQLQDTDERQRGLLDAQRQPKRTYAYFEAFKEQLLMKDDTSGQHLSPSRS